MEYKGENKSFPLPFSSSFVVKNFEGLTLSRKY